MADAARRAIRSTNSLSATAVFLNLIAETRPTPTRALRIRIGKVVCQLSESFLAVTQEYQLLSRQRIATSLNYAMFQVCVSVEFLTRVYYGSS